MQLYYASRDGQARKIATRIAERLAAHGIAATPTDLATTQPSPAELAKAALVVAVLAVRYGRHLPEAIEFVKTFALLDRPPPLALASVNLTARKPGKDTAEGSVYLRKLIARTQARAGARHRLRGKTRLPALRLFRQAHHPLHHADDRRPDRSIDRHRIHRLGQGRRLRRRDCGGVHGAAGLAADRAPASSGIAEPRTPARRAAPAGSDVQRAAVVLIKPGGSFAKACGVCVRTLGSVAVSGVMQSCDSWMP